MSIGERADAAHAYSVLSSVRYDDAATPTRTCRSRLLASFDAAAHAFAVKNIFVRLGRVRATGEVLAALTAAGESA